MTITSTQSAMTTTSEGASALRRIAACESRLITASSSNVFLITVHRCCCYAAILLTASLLPVATAATTTIVRPPPPAVPGSSCPHQQTSAWSPCSKTCGLGVSTRVSNLNSDCRLMRDVRLCFLRPCTAAKLAPKYGRRCMRQKRSDTKSRFAYAGCTSVRAFKLRYCGVCKEENRCCTPRQTRTSRIRFRCPDAGGRVFFKKVMVIKSCHCHRNCAAHVPTNRIPDTM